MLLVALAILTIIAISWLVVAARRRGVAWARVGHGVLDLAAGFAAASLSLSHLVAVSAVAARRATFEWDFRFASLLLVGVSLAVPGLVALACAWRLVRGSRTAWVVALVASITLVAVNAVLLPVQAFFASLLGGLALVNTIALLATRGAYSSSVAAAAASARDRHA